MSYHLHVKDDVMQKCVEVYLLQEVWYFKSASVAYGPLSLSLSLSLSLHDLQEISYHLHVQDDGVQKSVLKYIAGRLVLQ
jgi:hypothetical protein